eukprot:6564974-Alexandrium_andersonii.AAC.1
MDFLRNRGLSVMEPDVSFAIAFVQAGPVDDDAPLLRAFRARGSDEHTSVWLTAFKYYSSRVMVRASSAQELSIVELRLPLEFSMWRDAYAQAHDDALANNTTYRAE